MDENPYQSPVEVSAETDRAHDGQQTVPRGLMFIGSLFGGGFGALAAVIACVVVLAPTYLNSTGESLMIAVFFSGGVFGGTLLGMKAVKIFWATIASTPEPPDRH